MTSKNRLILLLLITCLKSHAQQDSAILNRLNKPIINCEIIAYNSQEIISGFTTAQYDSIFQILKVWEKECGDGEPIQRLKILFAIQQQKFIDTAYKDYIEYYFSNFQNRVTDAKNEKYREYFELNKSYYFYVPLRSRFDNLTRHFAKELLVNQEKGTSAYLFCLLFSENTDQFNEEFNLPEYKDNFIRKTRDYKIYHTWNMGLTFNVMTGLWLPTGKLAKVFTPSPQFGILFGVPVYKTFRLDLGFILRPLGKNNSLLLNVNDTTKLVRAKMCLAFGGWISKEFTLIDGFFIDVVGGIALGRIDTDLKKPKTNPEDNDSYYGVGAPDASIGINFRKKIFKRSSIGINSDIHYVPFNNNSLLHTDLGNQFASVSMIYRF